MPLAIDYRPKVLSEFEGNEALKKSLGAILKRPLKEIPRAFLFHGLSGAGKTTLGGIVANTLKCDPNEYYEVNSAHFRGIDSAREIDKVMRYAPMRGNVRIWAYQEVHKWTNDAQNAMLDIIEKAPAHVLFVLTTTDPQKLITPLRKRCVEYEVLPLSDDEMFDFLCGIVEDEKGDVPDNIIEKIVKAANGSSRNALQLLETVIDLSPADMEKAAIRLEDEETVTKDLIDALLKQRPWKEVSGILKKLTGEAETIRYGVLNYCNAIMMSGKDSKQCLLVMDCFSKNTYDTGRAGITMAAYEAVLK